MIGFIWSLYSHTLVVVRKLLQTNSNYLLELMKRRSKVQGNLKSLKKSSSPGLFWGALTHGDVINFVAP